VRGRLRQFERQMRFLGSTHGGSVYARPRDQGDNDDDWERLPALSGMVRLGRLAQTLIDPVFRWVMIRTGLRTDSRLDERRCENYVR
jgi:hypothetical protein